MAKWLERTKPLVPACILFSPAMIYERFWLGPWLLIAGLLWLWFAMDDQRRTIAALTLRLREAGHTTETTTQPKLSSGSQREIKRRNAFGWGLYVVAGAALLALNGRESDYTLRSVVAQAAIVCVMALAIWLQHRPESLASSPRR